MCVHKASLGALLIDFSELTEAFHQRKWLLPHLLQMYSHQKKLCKACVACRYKKHQALSSQPVQFTTVATSLEHCCSRFAREDLTVVYQISAGEDPKQYGRKDRWDTCCSTMFVMVSCRLGKIKPRKISCCCCRFDVLLFLFVLCRHAH